MTLEPFLRATPIVDWEHAEVRALAGELGRGQDRLDVVRACFAWVRDQVPHTVDHGLDPVTCSASEVLRERTGFCYAKSHLLAALLRANGVATGFVYQRLALDDGRTFCLHGLNAVWLPDAGWHRIDARGQRADLRADFDPPREVLPYASTRRGERLFARIRPDPVPLVIDALRRHRTRAELEANLPDAADLDETVQLRPYRPADQDAIVKLWWESWHSIRPGLRHPRPFADLAARWAGEIVPRHEIAVADDGGEVVGFAAVDLGAGLLSQLFVTPSRKRQGIGRGLFAWAQGRMPDGFILHTLVDNVASRAFYERHGLVGGATEINPANGMRTIEYRWTPGPDRRPPA